MKNSGPHTRREPSVRKHCVSTTFSLPMVLIDKIHERATKLGIRKSTLVTNLLEKGLSK